MLKIFVSSLQKQLRRGSLQLFKIISSTSCFKNLGGFKRRPPTPTYQLSTAIQHINIPRVGRDLNEQPHQLPG